MKVKGIAKDASFGGKPTLVGENPNEDREVEALIQEARQVAEGLKRKCYDTAGSFRGPGAWARVKKALASVS